MNYFFCPSSDHRVIGLDVILITGLSPSETVTYRFTATVLASLLSGTLASLFSQPGDTILSRVNSAGRNESSIH